MTPVERLIELIREAEAWRLFHKRRLMPGYIEALAASIRIRALKDALELMKDDQ